MISFFYDIALLLLGIAAAPKLIWNLLKQNKYRRSFGARFGIGLPKLRPNKDGPVIWLHAISVGETKALAPLYQTLKQKHPQATMIISSITETGFAEVGRSLKEPDCHFYLPLDFSWIIKRMLNRYRPDVLILGEGDFWYHLLHETKKRGGKCLLVNGKISERSTRRFGKLPFFSKRLFSCLDALCVQSFRYAQRFTSLGIEKSKITITGNLKLDADPKILTSDEKKQWKEELGILDTDCVVVLGSTHPQEEELLLGALQKVWKEIPHLKVVIVPRHPERFSLLPDQLKELGYSVMTYSQRSKKRGDEKVILVDTMGLLQTLYQLGPIAIVCGSFVRGTQGHNIFEPVQFGIPVLFGEYMDSQLDLVNLILEKNAGIQTSASKLSNDLLNLLQNPSKYQEMAGLAQMSAQEVRGATQRTLEILESYLE